MSDDESIQLYGETASEWLKRWDNGEIVWTIEMGGLGPGYEQVIAILTAEILRFYLSKKLDFNEETTDEQWETIRKERDNALFSNPQIATLGCTGAQVGAAASVAGHLYRHGPCKVMKDERVKDRHIQVSKKFP